MNILAFDTSHGVCSVALYSHNKIVADHIEHEKSKQAECLFALTHQVLEDASLSYADLDAVGVNIGPGSFTGVRVGVAAARGVGLAAKLPVVPVTSFESVAQQALEQNGEHSIMVVMDAKRGQVFSQLFNKEIQPLNQPSMLSCQQFSDVFDYKEPVAMVGNGVPLIKDYVPENMIISEINVTPQARSVAKMAVKKYGTGRFDKNAVPLYIRQPDAKISSK